MTSRIRTIRPTSRTRITARTTTRTIRTKTRTTGEEKGLPRILQQTPVHYEITTIRSMQKKYRTRSLTGFWNMRSSAEAYASTCGR